MKNILAFLRKQMGLSQESLAEKLGISRQQLSNYENDKSYPSFENQIKIERLFNKNIKEIFLVKP